MKKRFLLIGLSSLLLVPLSSCETVKDDPIKNDPIKDDVGVVPEKKEKTQFYLKNKLENFKRGMTVDLDEFVGVVPGTSDSSDSTEFKSYVLKAEGDRRVGYLEGGDGGSENKLTFITTGEIVVLLKCNGVSKTYTLKVEENDEFSSFLASLSGIGSNYGFEVKASDGKVNRQVVRKGNYLYDSLNKNGYLLSSLDDNLYYFTLPSIDSPITDLNVTVPPAGTKDVYNSLFTDLSEYSNGSEWIYTSTYDAVPQYKKYKYAYNYSANKVNSFFSSLFFTNSSYSAENNTFYPYMVLASYQNEKMSFLPVVSTSDLGRMAFLGEVSITSTNQTKVAALDEYIQEYMAPAKTDMSEITDNFTYCVGNNFDYSVTPTFEVRGADGTKLSRSSPYYVNNFERFDDNMHYYKVTKDMVYIKDFNSVTASGGLYSVNNKTYEYLDKDQDGTYEFLIEYIDGQSKTSYPNWYTYSWMNRYVLTLAYSSSNIKDSYGTYDKETGTYTISSSVPAGANVCWSALSVSSNIMNFSSIQDLVKAYSKATFNFTYKTVEGKKVLDKIEQHLYITYPKSVFTNFDQDYTVNIKSIVSSIGTTNDEFFLKQDLRTKLDKEIAKLTEGK